MRPRYGSLRGRGVVVTGGSSGIGATVVEAFWHQGAEVAFLDIDAAAAHQLVDRLATTETETNPVPSFVPVDLRDVHALRAAMSHARELVGPIRVLVNNAAWDQRHVTNEVSPEFWDEVQAINLRPHFFTTQSVIEDMRTHGGGSIINLSSNSYLLKLPDMPGYLAAKSGIIGLTKGLARELGPAGIRVNAVLPGWVMTPRQRKYWVTPESERQLLEEQCLKNLVQPEDIADTIVFLASDQSAMITAQSLIVDGGRC